MEKEYQNYLQALLSLLLELPAFDKPTSRDFLLTRIPVANWVRRSDEKGADLLYILQYSVGLSEIHPSGEQKELPLDVLYQNIAVYAPTGSDLGNKIEEQFRLLRAVLRPMPVKIDNPDRPDDYIPFTNREDEIKAILKPDGLHKYIDAPAGYGKTLLMLELKHEYQERGYLTAYAEVKDSTSTIFEVVNKLFNELDATPLQVSETDKCDPEILGDLFGKAIRQQVEKQKLSRIYNGFVLLIDNLGVIAEKTTIDLIKTFIYTVYDNLVGIQLFSLPPHEAIHFIFAGRYLGIFFDEMGLDVPFKRQQLGPFNSDVVFMTAQKVFPEIRRETIGNDRLRQIATHTFFLTGGHPGCIAKVLRSFKDNYNNPDRFIKASRQHIWEEFVKPEVENIWSATRELRPVFSELRFYRFFDIDIIKSAIPTAMILNGDFIKLTDSLTATYLIERTSRYYRDAITRRLMMLDAINEQPVDEFKSKCLAAYKIYLDRLADQTLQDRTLWAAEGIFQYIQSYAPMIFDANKRDELRSQLYSPDVLGDLLESFAGRFEKDKRDIELRALVETMSADWELKFMVNYYLRDEKYSPWEKLKAHVLDWRKED